MKTMTVVACRFRRGDHEMEQPRESGVAIGTSEKGMFGGEDYNIQSVVDSKGNVVPNVWSYQLTPAYGCFIMPLE